MTDAMPLDGMVFVPAGPFVMGSDPGEGETNEEPEHVVTLSAYYVDAREVTNAQWRACVTAFGCTEPSLPDSNTRSGYYTDVAYDDYPVIYVNQSQADAYCAWVGKRLPTEAEWEKAARGGCECVAPTECGLEDERVYPWGTASPACSLANFNPGTSCVAGGDTDAAGVRSPAGDSPYLTADMAGNVREWVADWYTPTYYAESPSTDPPGPTDGAARVVRGGAWSNNSLYLRLARRSFAPTTDQVDDIGLRCARSL